MLEHFYNDSATIQRLQTGLSGPFIDGFAGTLKKEIYATGTARRYIRAAAHLGHYVEGEGLGLDAINARTLGGFGKHLPSCRCPESTGGTTDDVMRGARLFLNYMDTNESLDIANYMEADEPEPELVCSFRSWLVNDCGLRDSTVEKYGRGAKKLIDVLGSNPGEFNPGNLRDFILGQAKVIGPGAAKTLVTALRMFLRYLAQQSMCSANLARAIPALACWRHGPLPSYLSAVELQAVLDACETTSLMGLRDHAIILLLARMGLRAGDVAELSLSKIDWEDGSFLVSGKGRSEVCLPLSQEVGDALVAYLEQRPRVEYDRIFLRIHAPLRPFQASSISQIVTRRMRQSGLTPSRFGAHILRHTAATEMLRQGVSLHEIGQVLRHRSLDMTAYYSKVDIGLLKQVAQPWPEVLSC